jgi:hypothetical protein
MFECGRRLQQLAVRERRRRRYFHQEGRSVAMAETERDAEAVGHPVQSFSPTSNPLLDPPGDHVVTSFGSGQ